MDNVKIASINVRGIRSKSKRHCIINWLKRNHYDIVCLQETYITEDIVKEVEKDFSSFGSIFSACSDSSHSREVSIVISSNLQGLDILNVHKGTNGHRVMINAKSIDQNKTYTFVSVYAPNDINARVTFLQDCREWVYNFASNDGNIIIAGDFNTTYRKLDRASGKLDKSGEEFRKFLDNLDLLDMFAIQNSQNKVFSYIHPSNSERNSRIDYILTSKHMQNLISETSILCCPAPDHKAVTLKLNLNPNTRGKGYWKLNNSLLKDEIYKNHIKNEITTTILEYSDHISRQNLLELIKIKIKEVTIKFATSKKQQRTNKISEIEYEINRLDKLIAFQDDHDLLCKRKKLFSELNALYNSDTEAAYIRSRAKWIDQGEKSTSYFLNLEKQHQSSNSITKLINENGEIAQNDKKILNHIEHFYSKLYKTNHPNEADIDSYLLNIKSLNILTTQDLHLCEGPISKQESEQALSKMKGNKSPGLDGLSIEFYKCFWPEIGDLVVDSFNEAFEDNMLSENRNTSIVSLIFKKGERTDLKNYRPISLTNTDYKLLAHILANRLHNVLDKIISPDQTGYIKKRFIGTNIRKILDTIEYLSIEQKTGIMLFLDFEKAFDTVEWSFLFKVLKKFNFGNEFIKWIKLLYKKPSATFKNNG